MIDVFATIDVGSLWLWSLVLGLAYIVLVGGTILFLKPVMAGKLDPLNISLLLSTGPALLGFIAVPFVTRKFTESHGVILIFLLAWILIIRMAGRPGKIDLSDKMPPDFQTILLVLALLSIGLNVLFNMIIPGKIPLFMEDGLFNRFEATQNSRFLSWFSLGLSPMPGLIFALTQHRAVRRFAVFSLAVQTAAGLLSASKGSLVTILFVLLTAMFVANLRGDTLVYGKLKRFSFLLGLTIACVAPFYFALIGFGGGSASPLAALGVRLLTGFDQLIYASQADLLRPDLLSTHMDVNLFEYQLMPFYKVLFSTKYTYSSVGQYVITLITGINIEGPFTFPNSNLILETIFTSGRSLGMTAFIVEMAVFYRLRLRALRGPITPSTLVLFYGMVMGPTGLFYSGQEWFTSMAVVVMTVLAALALAQARSRVAHLLRVCTQHPSSASVAS